MNVQGVPFLWYSLFFFVYSNGKKEHLDENNFRRSYGNFFETTILRSYLISAMFKVLSLQVRGIGELCSGGEFIWH